MLDILLSQINQLMRDKGKEPFKVEKTPREGGKTPGRNSGPTGFDSGITDSHRKRMKL